MKNDKSLIILKTASDTDRNQVISNQGVYESLLEKVIKVLLGENNSQCSFIKITRIYITYN